MSSTGAGAQHPGMIDLSRGDAAAALEQFERGVTLAGQDPDPDTVVAVGNNRSRALQALDRLPEALQVGRTRWVSPYGRPTCIGSPPSRPRWPTCCTIWDGTARRWSCRTLAMRLAEVGAASAAPTDVLARRVVHAQRPLAFATQEARWVAAARISSSAQAESRMPSTSSSEFSPEPDSAALI